MVEVVTSVFRSITSNDYTVINKSANQCSVSVAENDLVITSAGGTGGAVFNSDITEVKFDSSSKAFYVWLLKDGENYAGLFLDGVKKRIWLTNGTATSSFDDSITLDGYTQLATGTAPVNNVEIKRDNNHYTLKVNEETKWDFVLDKNAFSDHGITDNAEYILGLGCQWSKNQTTTYANLQVK